MAFNPTRKPVSLVADRSRTNSRAEDREPITHWVNIGYTAEDPETGEEIFVALPQGTPLNTMRRVSENSSNEKFAMLQGAKNNLLDEMMAMGEKLEPGETVTVDLQVQIRRVGEPAAGVSGNENPFVKSLGKLAAVG